MAVLPGAADLYGRSIRFGFARLSPQETVDGGVG